MEGVEHGLKVRKRIGLISAATSDHPQLEQLLSRMEGNDKLEQLLADVLSNTEKALALAKLEGIQATAAEAPKTEDQK